MKAAVAFSLFVVAASSAVTPIEQVLTMLSDLEAKILGEGHDAQKTYDEFAEFCEDRSRNVGFEIKTGKAEVQELEAAIANEAATVESLNAKIEELSSAISVDESDLKAATEIRDKEHVSFLAEEKELTEVISTLERAIQILEKEMSNAGSASMLQLQKAQSVAQALSVLVEASSVSSADASQLTAFLQQQQEDTDEDAGAPAASVYKSHSAGIVGTLQDLFEKAESQLEKARSAETKNVQAFQMMKQSLTDEIKYGEKDLAKAKKGVAEASEAKATAEGDLDVTSKDLAEDVKTLATLHQDCMKAAEDFEAEAKSRGEELKALADAKKIIADSTGGASDLSYSFLQLQSSRSHLSSGADLANFEAVRFIRDLARKQKSTALAQLAQKMAAAMRTARSGASDPFSKVKGLIQDMIERLLKEGEADATEKAFCDKEMAETEQKKSDKEAAIAKLNSQIDSKTAKSNQLKSQIAELQKQLAALANTQAQMDKLRAEEKSAYDKNSAEMAKGIEGVKMALKVLRDYYAADAAHGSAEGAGEGIIGLLEVVESDFTKGLAEMTATEEAAASEYDQLTKENEITKATKDQDVKYKTKESKGLDKAVAEAASDRASVQEELDAVNEYYKGLQGRCVAKAETYAERVKRRDAEIAGLKQALSILDGEAVLLQRTSKKMLLKHSH